MTTSRSDGPSPETIVAHRDRRRAPLVALLCATLAAGAAPLDTAPSAEPTTPADGAVVGPRPVFEIASRGLDDEGQRAARLRIRIESRAVGGPEFVHDQRRRRAGWALGEPGTLLFRPPRPLADGSYDWSVELWNGATWSSGEERRRFRVDTVPPAPVQNLRANRDPDRGVVRLEWDPVTVDVQGGTEFVARYHVYRYPRASDQRYVRAFEVTRTEDTRVEIAYDAADGEEGRWFLRVTAEDLAGNEAQRPELPEPPDGWPEDE